MSPGRQRAIRISTAEWEVMDFLWQGAPKPVRDIVEQLARRKGWKSSTSRTLLRRLAHKGAVRIHSQQRPFLYEPCVTREQCARHETRSLLQRLFGTKPVEALVHLVEETPLTSDDIQRLREILSRKEK
jgi:BlaI family penicillinase repressor